MSKKKQNYYVPVSPKEGKFTFVSTRKFKVIDELIPEDNQVLEFLKDQSEIIKKGGQFSTMKIEVINDLWKEIVQNIVKKVPSSKNNEYKSIDVCMEAGEFPIIQIIKKEEKNES